MHTISDHLKKNSDTFDSIDYEDKGIIDLFSKYVFSCNDPSISIQEKIQQILSWAKKNEVEHYSFLSFPFNSGICEKQESLLDLQYYYSNLQLKNKSRLNISHDLFLKGEADGSSFPSGGLRKTHQARAYNLLDQKSQIFIRKKNKVLYLPAMLVTHNGEALDDKILFRKSQKILQTNMKILLKTLGIESTKVFMALGLEQQFFVIPKKAYESRLDLRATGRTLIGDVCVKNQQFSDHYYGKIPFKIQQILKEVENELLQIGVPFKTKHNEVANNQFEFCSIYSEAGKAIDHNMITMQILKECFDRHGYTVLLHQKPFRQLNGSGKHANWSLNYCDIEGNIKNLFSIPQKVEDRKIFKLFILLNLMALLRNNKLYFAAIAPPGNQIRLGGHEAPPRIISAFLGESISAILDNKQMKERKNLKESVFSLEEDIFQEDTDRNRTSPYAYTGHKFEFRALGASQNPAFPMAVIAATLANEIDLANQKLNSGYSIDSLIQQLSELTKPIRFEGNGYSLQWVKEAKNRNLYVNEQFYDIFNHLEEASQVFIKIGASTAKQVKARSQIMKENYLKIAEVEVKSFIEIINKNIIPKCFEKINKYNTSNATTHIKKYVEKFVTKFDKALQIFEKFEMKSSEIKQLRDAGEIRDQIQQCSIIFTELMKYLQKDDSFPSLEDFLRL